VSSLCMSGLRALGARAGASGRCVGNGIGFCVLGGVMGRAGRAAVGAGPAGADALRITRLVLMNRSY
jgi:hypothetical protein